MPAHTLTMKMPFGMASYTAQDPTNSQTVTDVGAFKRITGPPCFGAANTRGVYCMETAGTSGSFRWIYDEPIDKTLASPTTFLYVGCPVR